MWWRVSWRRWRSSARTNIRARSGGPASRSNGRWASATARRRATAWRSPTRHAAQVGPRQGNRARRRDHLPAGGTVDDETGAQRLVPADDLGEAAGERLDVERSLEQEGRRDVVLRALRRIPVEEPEPLLGKGQQRPVAVRPARDPLRLRQDDRPLRPAAAASAPAARPRRPPPGSRRSFAHLSGSLAGAQGVADLVGRHPAHPQQGRHDLLGRARRRLPGARPLPPASPPSEW